MPAIREIESSMQRAVQGALPTSGTVVLAVSGGVDSMVLLDAAVLVLPRERLHVATFDHGTGPAATAAAALVGRRARSLGIRCTRGRARGPLSGEAEWRRARWGFLRAVAARVGGVVATAHTRDDQLETVVMRVLRGAGARGLAGLYAPSAVCRPLIETSRQSIVEYARERGVVWIEDPSNESPAYFRNRVRRDLLPAMRSVRPSLDAELLEVAREAADWRRELERQIDAHVTITPREHGSALDVPTRDLAEISIDGLSILWPAIAARVGATLDRRAIDRLVHFTRESRVGTRARLAGGWEVVRSRDAFRLRQASRTEHPGATLAAIALSNDTRWREWIFRPIAPLAAERASTSNNWVTWLPTDEVLAVRAWEPGDAMLHGATRRKVKRLLSGAGITGHERAGWPVVMSGAQVVWVPGVRRSDAASERSGRPGLSFSCEHIDR